MPTRDSITLEEIQEALRQLGGKATLKDTKERVTNNRGGVPPEYVSYYQWWNALQTVIEDHLDGLLRPEYVKGPVAFCLIQCGTVEEGESVFDDKAVIALSVPKQGR